MKKILFLIAVLFTVNQIVAQDIINVYANWEDNNSPNIPDYYNPVSGFYWSSSSSGIGPYTGEYQIALKDFFWGLYTGGANPAYQASYVIETVSFPFTMDCAFTAAGCTTTSTDRYLFLPDDANLDNTNPNGPGEWWNYPPVSSVATTLYRITPLDGLNTFNNGNLNTPPHDIVSINFISGGTSTNNRIFPHTVLKITLNLHCGTNIQNDIISSVSFVYDNTRGRMRWYPFFNDNSTHSGGNSKNYYDIIFVPQLQFFSGAYNETDDELVLENGTINYFPFAEINNMGCSVNYFSALPDSTDVFANLPNYNFAFPPPYSLMSGNAKNYNGGGIAGYEISNGGYNKIVSLKQNYFIDKNIDLTNINPTEKIIYNPSEADITANNLHFPTGYIFKTIRGQYPTPSEVADDDIAANGGPFADDRDVPVTTDVTSENSTYASSGANYASMYYLKNGSKLTVEGCVYIFDATFDCQTGSELVFENFPTNKNPDRFNILYSGGTVTKRAHDFYFQNETESDAILKFESDGVIEAGYNVTASPYGNYTVASGANVTFTSDDAVTLKNGFTAVSGSNFVAKAVSSVTVTDCTDPQFRLAGYNHSNNHSNDNTEDLKIVAWPNPTSGIFRVQLSNGERGSEKQIYVTDMYGKQVMPVDYNYRSRNLIDLSNYPEGIYFVKVIEGDRTAVSKIVKM